MEKVLAQPVRSQEFFENKNIYTFFLTSLKTKVLAKTSYLNPHEATPWQSALPPPASAQTDFTVLIEIVCESFWPEN